MSDKNEFMDLISASLGTALDEIYQRFVGCNLDWRIQRSRCSPSCSLMQWEEKAVRAAPISSDNVGLRQVRYH